MTSNPRLVLVVDFSVWYAQFTVRRMREVGVYSEIVPHMASAADMLAKDPVAIVLSGGPSSVYEEGVSSLDPAIFDVGVSILGTCYGFQIMAQAPGGAVGRAGTREYGYTEVSMAEGPYLLDGTPADQVVWMSHGDAVQAAPEGFGVTASTSQIPVVAFKNRDRKLFGLQWHPEVGHSAYGQAALENFLHEDAGLKPVWMPGNIIDEQVEAIRRQVGGAQAICTLSGDVDSSAAVVLVHVAVGDQLMCLFIGHGLLRAGERERTERDYAEGMSIRVAAVDGSQRFLDALNGVSDPEAERKIIECESIRSFEAAQARLIADIGAEGGEVKFLVQGTLYPDVIESGGGEGAVNIKSHHNVGGLPEDMVFELIEPLRALFKDEAHVVGRELGVPEKIVARQPFPGPDLGIRIVGEVTRERLETLRAADLIMRGELTTAGLDEEIWQCPAVLLADVRPVGVQGDGRIYGYPVVLRSVSSEDAMTADWTRLPCDVLTRISTCTTNSVPEVNRVVLDCASKPPGAIEWERKKRRRLTVPSTVGKCPDAPRRVFVMRHMAQVGDGMTLPQRLLSMR